jgi:phosphoglucosamine mutase
VTKRRYFGTDGIRGRVGEEPITPQTMVKLGWAAGAVFARMGKETGKVIIGKDTRVSGYLLESALEAGFSAAGVDVSLLGPMPTPGIAYLTRTARAHAGVVISASHNAYEDNGIKFFSPDGLKLADDVELAIEAAMDTPLATVSSRELGKAERYPDAAGRYIEYCKSTIPHRLTLDGMKIALDCANGAAYYVAPSVFEELGADVTTVGVEPDGFNINQECGSTHLALLQQTVREIGADVGIALDGDGDRVIMVDADGEAVDGDQILYVLAMARAAEHRLDGGIVGTQMTNLGLEQACLQQSIPFKRARVGDRYVLATLIQEGWSLGGESSGHIICLDKSTTGDGIIAALEVLEVMATSGKSLASLKAGMQVYPQTMVNVRTEGRFDFNGSAEVKKALKLAEGELAANGRVLLRASGTEPVIRVMVEGSDAILVQRLSQYLADTVKSAARHP